MEVFHGLECSIKLWDHQKRAALDASKRKFYGFFFEVGTGKTAAAITAARFKYTDHARLLRTMIFGPPVILKNWEAELKQHLPKDLHPFIHVVYGPGEKRVKQLKEILDSGLPYIVITNYQSFLMPKTYDGLFALRPELMIFDELHRLKNKSASTTKKAVTLADGAIYKFGLTGTLITNNPMDIWSQYRIMDGGETFGKNFFVFRQKYFYDKNAGMPKDRYFPDWKVRAGSLEEFNSRIHQTGLIVKKKDCLDLPPLLKQTIAVDMSPEQRRAYISMKEFLIAAFADPDQTAVAEFAMTKALRLQQIVSGHCGLDDGSVKVFKDNPRKDALADLLEDKTPASKVIVWAVFRENYQDIKEVCKKLKIKYVELHGDVGSNQRFESIEAFNNDPEVRVLIGHPGSGGIGVNLIASDVTIWYSRGFSLEQYIQAEARNYRGGSEVHSKITHIDLVAPGTIDEEVARKLGAKQAISDSILKGMLDGGDA